MPVLVLGDVKYPYKDMSTWDVAEGIAVQQATGLKWNVFLESVGEGDLEALQAFVWAVRKQNGEADLRIGDVHFGVGEFRTELSEEEAAERARAEAEAKKADPTPGVRRGAGSRSRGSGVKASSS